MGYIVYLDVAALCVLGIVLLSGAVRKGLWDTQNKVLFTMVLGDVGIAVTNILSAWLGLKNVPGAQMALNAVNYCFFAVHMLVVLMFCCYCRCLTGRQGQTARWKKVVLGIPAAFMLLLMLIQPFTHIIFWVDSRLMFHRMSGGVMIYIGSIFYTIVGISYLVRYRSRISVEARISCWVFVFVLILCIAIQYFFPRLLIESFGIAISILMFYLSMEKPGEMLDSELDILNQRAMLRAVEEKYQTSEVFCCIVLKVHNLKAMRQTMGTDAVTEILRRVAIYLDETFERARLFHFSQSVFVIMLDKKFAQEDTGQMIRMIRERFERPWSVEKHNTKLHIHIAYMQCPKDAPDINTFINYLQYMRTNSGENRKELLLPSDMNIERRSRQLRIRKILADAVENGEFDVFYQPIFSVGDKRIVSAEALIRLRDRSLGYISPEEFIPIAEQSGTILKIGEFVFESVCRLLWEENLKAYGIRYIEINLSIVQCMQDNLVERLSEIMEKYKIGPDQINLEITETAALHTTEVLEENIQRLHEKGISFSLDDYGSGYANTEYLFRFPFRMVKIDKQILWEACKNEKAMITLQNTIHMIKDLGLEVVVEGVETSENVDFLMGQKCDFLQGYYYSRPIPRQQFLDLIRRDTKIVSNS